MRAGPHSPPAAGCGRRSARAPGRYPSGRIDAAPSTPSEEFRAELESLQLELRNYNRLLAEIAGVEDLTNLEQTEGNGNGANQAA